MRCAILATPKAARVQPGTLSRYPIAVGAVCALALAACTSPAPQASPFERCMVTVAGSTPIQSDRMKAAEWCSARVGVPS